MSYNLKSRKIRSLINAYTWQRFHCLIKDDSQNREPIEWLRIINSAVEAPLEVIKADGMKRSLKVNIVPWGVLYMEEFRWNLSRIILSPFRLSRAKRIWTFSDYLIKNQILVPEPVIFFEIQKLIFVTKTYIATRWIEQGFDFGRLVSGKDIAYDYNFESILYHGVDMIAKLHNLGLMHGDLKWSNLFYIFDKESRIILIDLDSVKRCSSPYQQGRDFARFILSALEFQYDDNLVEELINRYLKGRGLRRSLVEKSLRSRIQRKRNRYEGRSKTKS
jgi:tRNA A-37 threonylcarbamoyl transferase component Bud32